MSVTVSTAAARGLVARRALNVLAATSSARCAPRGAFPAESASLSTTTTPQSFDFSTIVDRTKTESMKWGRYANKDVVPMWVADMDFKCAPCIVDAITKRAEHGIYGYGLPSASLIQAVLGYLDRIGFSAFPGSTPVSKRDLVFLSNVMSGVGLACTAFAAQGESVMTTTPIYPPFLSKPKGKGRNVIDVPLKQLLEGQSSSGAGWTLDLEAMEAAVTPCTKVFLLCNPHNPVGHVYSRHELEALNAFCAKHDLVVCSDEVHCDLVFPDSPRGHIPFASLSADAASRCVSVYAANKTYNVPSLGCAYAVVTSPALRARFMKAFAADYSSVDPSVFGYTALETAYSQGGPWLEELLVYLQGNRDFVHSFIEQHMDPKYVKLFARPDATYLVSKALCLVVSCAACVGTDQRLVFCRCWTCFVWLAEPRTGSRER
jgi:cystathionine beta-lyase